MKLTSDEITTLKHHRNMEQRVLPTLILKPQQPSYKFVKKKPSDEICSRIETGHGSCSHTVYRVFQLDHLELILF